MKKIVNLIHKFHLVFILIAIVPAVFLGEATEFTQSIFAAKLLILVQCCILGVITYFLTYGFFNLAIKLFNKI